MKSFTRIAAVIRKELREIVRRPGAVLSLAIGPLAIMALFGIGFTGQRTPSEVVVVVPTGATDLPRDTATYEQLARGMAHVVAVTEDLEGARARVDRGEIRMILIVPADARQRLEHGEQATLICETNELDPVEYGTDQVVADTIARELNARIITEAAKQGEARMQAAGAAVPVPPEVLARPVNAAVQSRAPATPQMVIFYTPAVLALVLQHLGITLTALSMVRERLLGAIDIFRVAPIRAAELLVGKYVAYAILSLVVALALVLVTTNALHIPFRGSAAAFAVAVALLTFSSLGLGLLISLISDTERQAVQLSMIVLLMSVFFSGFVLPVHEFRMPVQALSYVLPVTYAIAIFQQEMLRGELRDVWMPAALAAIGGSLFVLSAARLRSVLRGTD